MAAVITVSALSLASDGVTLTGTLGGGTAPYSITSAAGLLTHTSGNGDYIAPTATPTISGTTLTIVLPSRWWSGDTIQFDISASSTLTDSASNTPVVASNTAITNNSTVTGTKTSFVGNLPKFNFNGSLSLADNGNSISEGGNSTLATVTNTTDSCGYSVEWVLNVTSGTVDVDLEGRYQSGYPLYYQVDGGAQQTFSTTDLGNYQYIRLATGLGVGKHVIRHNCPINYYTRAVRWDGGTANLATVACPVALFADNVPSTTAGTVTSPVARWGTLVYSAYRTSNNHPGFQFKATGNFQGVDVVAVTFGGGGTCTWGIGTDVGTSPCPIGSYNEITVSSDLNINNTFQIQTLVAGLSAGAHTVEAIDVGTTSHEALRVWNGSALTSAASSGATTIQVGDVTNIAAGDWLCLDTLQNEEVVKVQSISGTSSPYTLTLGAALAKNHAVGVGARNFTPANPPTLTAATRPSFAGRVVALGDSITHAAAVTAAGAFPAGYVQYDVRASWCFMACRDAGWDFSSGATQGWRSSDLANDSWATKDAYAPGDIYVVMIGTNDFGGNTTIASYQANLQTVIGQIKQAAPKGCTILFATVVSSPYTTTNGNGNTKTDFTNAIQAAINATAAPGYKMELIDFAWDLSTATTSNPDYPGAGPHPYVDGTTTAGPGAQNRQGRALLPYLTKGVSVASFMMAAG